MRQSSYYKRRTKIVCTIGPATGSVAVIERLVRAGMNVARLNLTHGDLETHARYIERIRSVSRRLSIPVAILMDLPGPKYRTGALEGGQAVLKNRAIVTLTSRDVVGNASTVAVSLPGLAQGVKTGDTILLDDGAMELKVLSKSGDDIKCRVTAGGVLTEKRGLVVPGMPSSGPFMTEKLKEQILFCVKQQPDYVAISFVSRPSDVEEVREVLRQDGSDIPIVSKIERIQAVHVFDKILEASDAIMVARGDLGVDMPLEKVPLVQKEIIRKCNRVGKPVITATQMLESMVNATRPTRAEVTDIANAIFDGTDATMLSAETSVGKYPVNSVRTMAKIARETEHHVSSMRSLESRERWIQRQTDELISYSACHISENLNACAIVAFTQSGSTARRVSKYRPGVPILAITSSEVVSGRLLLHWGVFPFEIDVPGSVDELFATAASLSKSTGIARPGNLIVITGGVPLGTSGYTNLLKVDKIS